MGDEDQEAKELMAKMGLDGDIEAASDSEEEMDPEALLEPFRREVEITPDNCVDQVILGTSDLEKAVEEFEKMTGTKPVWVTSMNGLGTKSARVGFKSCAYLEIIGPDPKQSITTPFKEALEKLPAGELTACHYSVRWEKSHDLQVRMEWKKLGLDYDQITMVAKDRGMPWLWDMYFMKGEGGIVPFITDWKTHDTMHASAKLPICGELASVKVSAPGDHVVHKLLENPSGLDLSIGEEKLEFTISTPNGSHTFSSCNPIGISYPDEGGIEVQKFG